jgi:hypothetical protein
MSLILFKQEIGCMLRKERPRLVVEIGVGGGKLSRFLDMSVKQYGGSLMLIDPEPEWNPPANYQHFRRPSLDVIPSLDGINYAIIDGDHNWYTVFSELRLLSQRMAEPARILLHDVCWPYAYRDLYYCPERIPEAFRHPYARQGIIEGQSRLSDDGGKSPHLCHALTEGGSRNGVLKAVEDFMQTDKAWTFSRIERGAGMGLMTRDGITLGSFA